MLSDLKIQNFKSIRDLSLKLGRVTVLIGENGCGKSNILEALAFASAAAGDKLDGEFLASRGIRVTEPRFMRSAFSSGVEEPIRLEVGVDGATLVYSLVHADADPTATWRVEGNEVPLPTRVAELVWQQLREEVAARHRLSAELSREQFDELVRPFAQTLGGIKADLEAEANLKGYLIYSPENTALRSFEEEGQIQPLGIKGQGLFRLVQALSADAERLAEMKEHLRLIDWFADLAIPGELAPFQRTIQILDRYLAPAEVDSRDYFDQRSSNEGFLFLLFYFALFIGPGTPSLFAIDNLDASLNPKLCTELMQRISALAQLHDKQVLITTHNPAVLDGLNLHDEDQRLYVVYRNSKGETRARRARAPEPIADELPIKLSEAFLRGLLGGLPQNF